MAIVYQRLWFVGIRWSVSNECFDFNFVWKETKMGKRDEINNENRQRKGKITTTEIGERKVKS
jgi:hypothetical protein